MAQFLTNPGGRVQAVSDEQAAALLTKQGWRTSTDDELASYHKASMPADAPVPSATNAAAIAADTFPEMQDGESDEAFLARLTDDQIKMVATSMDIAIPAPFDRVALTAALLAAKSKSDAAAKASK